MLEGLIKVVFWILQQVSNILLYPITALFDNLFPDVSSTIVSIETWLDNNVWSLVAFVKQCMINLGIPQVCFTFIIAYYTAIMGLWVGSQLYIFGYNVYKHFKP